MPTINGLDQILTVPTACLIVVLAVMTLLARKLVEAVWPTLSSTTPLSRAQRVWEMFGLPALPAVLGMLFCLAVPLRSYPYPPVAAVTPLSRVLYGFTLGWFSSGGYRGISALLKRKWNVSLPGDTDPPPPLPTTIVIPRVPPPRNE
jgi:hypothetical protein